MRILKKIGEMFDNIREWLFENHNNPMLWISIFAIGLIMFKISYDVLHKDR